MPILYCTTKHALDYGQYYEVYGEVVYPIVSRDFIVYTQNDVRFTVVFFVVQEPGLPCAEEWI